MIKGKCTCSLSFIGNKPLMKSIGHPLFASSLKNKGLMGMTIFDTLNICHIVNFLFTANR